jgi:hypothetical protein
MVRFGPGKKSKFLYFEKWKNKSQKMKRFFNVEISCAKKLQVRSTRNKDDLSTQFRRCISLFILLGLPWLFLTLNVFSGTSNGRLALHVLIIIFCGTQGLTIFAIEVYGMRKEVRKLLQGSSNAPTSTGTFQTIIKSTLLLFQ